MLFPRSIAQLTCSPAATRAFSLLAGLVFGCHNAAAGCCDGSAQVGRSAKPLSRMMGPLNEPLDASIVNPSAQTKSGTLGGLEFTSPPGQHDAEFGGTSAAHAPQPGEKLDFVGNGTGVQRKACPPGTLSSSGGLIESASANNDQYVGQARVTDNLDSAGTSMVPRVHGAGGISPGQMGRDAGLSAIIPPCIHYSANIGAFTDGAAVSRGSSGILRTKHGNSTGPHRIVSYEVVGSAVPIPNVESIVAPGGEVTELYEQSASSLLINFRSSASATVPHKTVLITKLAPDDVNMPEGYDEAWNFTVSYPGGESANTLCAIDLTPGPSGELRTSVKQGEVEREWTSGFGNGVRKMIYRERVNGVLVRYTTDEYAPALWNVAEEMLISSTVATEADGTGLTTYYRYWWDHSDAVNPIPYNPNNGKLQQVVHPDGSWEMSAVSSDGLRSVVLRPWLSNAAPPVIASDPTPGVADDMVALLLGIEDTGPNFEIVDTIRASATLSDPDAVESKLITRAGVAIAMDEREGSNFRMYNGWNATDIRLRSDGRWYSADGWGARRVDWTGLGSAAPILTGFVDRVEVSSLVFSGVRTTTEHRQAYGGPAAGAQAPVFSTVTTSSTESGNTLTEISQFDGTTFEVVEYQYETSTSGRYTGKLVNGVPVETVSYQSNPPAPAIRSETRTSSDGTSTTTRYDSHDRPVFQRVAGAAAGSVFGAALPEQPASVTTWSYQSRAGGLPGWIVTTSISHEPVSSTVARVTVEEYDGAGRLVRRQLPDSSERFYDYAVINGERRERVYAGKLASDTSLLSETVYFRDQRRKSVSGAAEIASLWQYSVPAPFRTKVVHLQAGQVVSEVTTDAFGRPVTAVAPVSPTQSGGATFFTSSFTYDPAHGGLVSRTVPSPSGTSASEVTRTSWSTDPAGGAKTLEIISGVSAAPNPFLNEATAQSLRRVVRWTEVDASAGWLTVGGELVALVWECEAVYHAAQSGGWQKVSIRQRAVSDRPKSGYSWNGHAAGAAPVSWVDDGGTIYTTARSIAGVPEEEPLSSETVTRRSGAMFRRVVARGGLDMAFSSPEAANVLLPYNGWREALAEPSWDAIPHWPRLEISPATGQVTSRLIPGSSVPTTVYTYYTLVPNVVTSSDIRIGRLRSEASWDQLANSIRGTTYYHYDAAGRVTASWGSAAATTLHTYDAAGRRTGLRTFRSEPSAFAGLVPGSFSAVSGAVASSSTSGDLTQWVYSTNFGIPAVTSKIFPDGTSTDYSYNAAGQVQTRTWARTVSPTGPKVTTTYSWNFAGQLTGIGYNDGTPNVAFSYDRSGRVRYRTDGTGVTRMDYRFDGSPLTETTVDSASDTAVLVAGGRHLSRAYDSSGRLWKMEAAWGQTLPGTASTAGSSTLSPQVVFSYGAADRLVSIYSGGFTGAVTRTATQESFSVSPNTGLYYPPSVYSTVYRDAQGLPSSHAAGGTINVAGSPSPFSISTTQFGWNGDRLVSRTEAPDAKWNYTYDSKGQVRDAWKTVQNGGSAVTLNGTQSRYSYDDMGNRTSLGEGPGFARMTTWTPNNLNQYTSVARQRTFDVTGRRSPGASIAVNSPFNANGVSYQPTSNGLYYHIELTNSPTPGNSPSPEEAADTMEPVSVTQDGTVISPPGALQWVGRPTQTLDHDADGNLRFDGRWTMTWDGENRLVKLERPAWIQPTSTTEGYSFTAPPNPQGIPPNELPAATIEFKYDGLSRLVERKVTRGVDPPEVEGYQWDGWKLIMIAKLNTDGTFHSRKWSCVWRPDVGSSLYARSDWMRAGGVGGVAWLQTGAVQSYSYGTGGAEVHVPLADHMGNVRHYYQFKATKGKVIGQLVASYEYDAFGREVRAWGLNTPTENQPPGLPASRPWADHLPFHYSSKLRDVDSGFNYYGYRFYDPGAGRWLNRDPIGENGGVNLYGMCYNAPILTYDILGREPPPAVGDHSPNEAFPVAPEHGGGNYDGKPDKNKNCLGHACGNGENSQPAEPTRPADIESHMTQKLRCKKVDEKTACSEIENRVLIYIDPQATVNPNDRKKVENHHFHAVAAEGDSTYSAKIGGMGTVTGITDPDKHTKGWYPDAAKREWKKSFWCFPCEAKERAKERAKLQNARRTGGMIGDHNDPER